MMITRNRRARTVLALALAGLLSGAVVSSASALNTASYWNSSSTPLVTSGYGSTAQAYGYVKVANGSNGTRLSNYAWNKFVDADNHRSYLDAKSQWNAGTCRNFTVGVSIKGVVVNASVVCSRDFFDGDTLTTQGLTYTNSSWVAFPTASAAAHSGSDRGRGKVNLCIDIPLRTDVCGGASYSEADTF